MSSLAFSECSHLQMTHLLTSLHILMSVSYLKPLLENPSSTVTTWLSMSPSDLKWDSFNDVFSFRNKEITHVAKSGNYARCFKIGVSFLAKNCFTKNVVREGTLLWCKIHLSSWRFHPFPCMNFCKYSRAWRSNACYLFWRNEFVMDNSFQIKKADQQSFVLWFWHSCFFGLGTSDLFHWKLLYFAFGSYWKTKVTSPGTIYIKSLGPFNNPFILISD